MGSLNGDVMVIRNGRSTSQVSVYNYPEHLNPFYEDDQHKRLRFWKLGKKDGSEPRRNSFSISNLKDLWAFKSFRPKKKSSTLGINKTSESPPPLRRDFYAGSSLQPQDAPFQRNGLYRSSLQNVTSTPDEFGFAARQNDYRRTMQAGLRPQPHNYGNRYGALTPQSYHKPVRNNADLSRGSSQLSVASTNPFDTDDDECHVDDDDVGAIEQRRTSLNASGVHKTPRKKRRAPPPPPPAYIQQAATPITDASHANAAAAEDGQDLNISNLSAQIQSFVESSTNESELEVSTTTTTTTTTTPVKKPQTATTTTTTKEVEVVAVPVAAKREKPLQIVEPETELQTRVDNEEVKILNTIHNNSNNNAHETNTSCGNHSSKINEKSAEMQQTTENNVSTVESCPPQIEKSLETHENNVHIMKTTERKVSVEKVQYPQASVRTQQKPQNTETVAIVTTTTTTTTSPRRQEQIEQIRNEKSQKQQQQQQPEIGHVECIHVHLKSPTLSKRQTDDIHVSSFRPENHTQSVLKSPKTENKRDVRQEPVDELRINEEDQQRSQTPLKPAIRAKPQILVQTKIITDNNSKRQTQEFSSIHKPHRHMHVGETTTTSCNGKTDRSHHEEAHTETKPLNCNSQVVVVVDVNDNNEETATPSAGALKIVESKEDILKEDGPSGSGGGGGSIVAPPSPSEVIDNSLYRRFPNATTQRDAFDWKQSTLAPLEPVPPEKRKSVKDIIESINRSQRLLTAAAQKSQPHYALETTPDVNTNGHLYLQQQETAAERAELEEGASFVASHSSDMPQHKDPLKIDNSEILKKFEIRKEVFDFRESSPTASNLDWNPVPKPKRTKNFSDC